jgi:5,10-methylenetetrahydromethanopterin reductase
VRDGAVVDISCAFATSPATPEHIAVAEALGYRRAWAYDSPALLPDVWVALALAAERTSRIGLGPAVLVPSLRHPMTNAAAIAGLCALAPGRVAVAVGSGFTGRHTLGQRPLRWSQVETYVRTVRALLAGETVEWDGAPIRMLHPAGFVSPRPLDVPFLIGAEGPRGTAVAERVGDGIFAAALPNASAKGWHALLQFGTVLQPGEDLHSPRVLDAAGPGLAAAYHARYERGGAAAVQRLPGGAAWAAAVEAIPAAERHLAIHEGHLVHLTDRDRTAISEGPDLLGRYTLTGAPHALRERVAALASAGVTELVYQPAGPDIPGELERFLAASDRLCQHPG